MVNVNHQPQDDSNFSEDALLDNDALKKLEEVEQKNNAGKTAVVALSSLMATSILTGCGDVEADDLKKPSASNTKPPAGEVVVAKNETPEGIYKVDSTVDKEEPLSGKALQNKIKELTAEKKNSMDWLKANKEHPDYASRKEAYYVLKEELSRYELIVLEKELAAEKAETVAEKAETAELKAKSSKLEKKKQEAEEKMEEATRKIVAKNK